jgi:hypothetical protein
MAVAEDVLNVTRRIMAWRLNEACQSPGLPRAVAAGFVTLLEAILAHLPSPAADPMLAERAHHELVEALWTRLSPQALVASSGFAEASNGPPVAAPLGPVTAEADLLPFLLSVCSDLEETKLMESTLTGARSVLRAASMKSEHRSHASAHHGAPSPSPQVLHAASMKSEHRTRLLLMLCAVLRLPMHAAVACDACWREAVTALCMLSSSTGGAQDGACASLGAPNGAQDGARGAQDGACASLAAPKLLQVARVVLNGWADVEGAKEEGAPVTARGVVAGVEDVKEESMLALRAAQIAHLLSHLSSMRLAEGALPAPNSQGRSIPARIAPAMIQCIGEPRALFARGKVPVQVLELQSAIRTALQGVAAELGLGTESSVSSVSSEVH